jgi:hypothetical protein
MPKRNRRLTDAPLASGVPSVIVPAESDALMPPPLTWLGGCSSVVPSTVLLPLVVVTTMAVEVRARRSAVPEGDGKVTRLVMRKRSRVTGAPVLLVHVRRKSSVPNVELLGGLLVKSRTTFGAVAALTAGSISSRANLAAPV